MYEEVKISWTSRKDQFTVDTNINKKIRPKDPPTKSELLLTKFELKTVNTSQEDRDQIHNL